MLTAAPTRDEDDAAKLCQLILKSFGSDQGAEVRRLVGSNPHCVNVPGRTGETPLFLAVNARNADLVKFLLVSNADPNGCAANGRTALHELASTSSHATAKQDCELVEALVMYNASVEKYDANRSQPIDIARMYNAPDAVQRALGRLSGAIDSTSATAATAGVTGVSAGSGAGSIGGLRYTPSREAVTAAAHTPLAAPTVRAPVTPELLSLYNSSANKRRDADSATKLLQQTQAQQRVDELLARAQDRHRQQQLTLTAASASASSPVVPGNSYHNHDALLHGDFGPYRLLHDKVAAELRESQRQLRTATEELDAAKARVIQLETANRELALTREEVNLERAKAVNTMAVVELTEYKQSQHRRMVALQQALTKLKDNIKESDEVGTGR